MATEGIAGKLKAFGFLLKYSHDLFEMENFSDAAISAVNDSRVLLNYTTSSLFLVCDGHVELAAQFGVAEINPHARQAVVQKTFVETHQFSETPEEFKEELPEEMSRNDMVYLAFSLPLPKRAGKAGFSFVWLIGYEKAIPQFAVNTAKLIGKSMADALSFHRLFLKSKWAKVRYHAKKRWLWIGIVMILTTVMFIRVPESVNAEFTLKAPQITAAYAWFDGPIAKCLKQDGEYVSAGEVIAEYETEQLHYRLDMAKSALRECKAELALEEQKSFTDSSKLGVVELLKAKCRSLQIAVDEAQWYLDHAKIKAPASGILALSDGRAELLSGRTVRTGDKLFEIFGGNDFIAEILVNERDASVLAKDMKIQLFLYTSPEKGIAAEILEVSHYPELTEQKTYCYKIRGALSAEKSGLRLGMRGIAKISGSEVTLGYFLFKSVVLYVRGM